jgi:hypothetical protein
MGTFELGEGSMRFSIAALVLSASCASAPSPTVLPMISGDTDTVRLRTGEVVQGKIVKTDDAHVAVESAGRLRVFARKDVQESSFAPAKEKLDPVPPVRRGVDPSQWFPLTKPTEKVEVVQILFFEPHSPATCLGALAKPRQDVTHIQRIDDAVRVGIGGIAIRIARAYGAAESGQGVAGIQRINHVVAVDIAVAGLHRRFTEGSRLTVGM